jgi:hypothetical protein
VTTLPLSSGLAANGFARDWCMDLDRTLPNLERYDPVKPSGSSALRDSSSPAVSWCIRGSDPPASSSHHQILGIKNNLID